MVVSLFFHLIFHKLHNHLSKSYFLEVVSYCHLSNLDFSFALNLRDHTGQDGPVRSEKSEVELVNLGAEIFNVQGHP